MAAQGSWQYFHRAIMESGPIAASWISMPLSGANIAFHQLRTAVGCNSTTSTPTAILACLRAVPAATLYAAGRSVEPGNPGSDDVIGWAPVVDGVVLTEAPYEALKNGHVPQIPVLFGTNRDEGTEFVNQKHVPNEASYKVWAETKFGQVLAPQGMSITSQYNLLTNMYHVHY